MPQQFIFKSYVPKPAPKANQRTVGTKLPTRTDITSKTSIPGDSFEAPSGEIMQQEINGPGLGVHESVHSGGMGEEMIAVHNTSAVLDGGLQLREVVQEESVPRSQTEDFEDWLRQDNPSPEQSGNKHTQQPTPEYDDSDTEDARRKRPRLAREVCQNTLVDSGATAGAHRKEGVAKTDDERQATVQELASPLNLGLLSTDCCTATNPHTPRTQSSNDASQVQGDACLIERPAYACKTRTRSLISALALTTAPLPRNGLSSEARTCLRCAPTGSCTPSGHQDAIQESVLAEQRSSWELRAADLAKRAAGLDQRVVDLDRRAAGLDQRAASLDQRAASMDQRVAELDQRAAEMDQRALHMDGPAAEMWQRDADHDQRVTVRHQQSRAPFRLPSPASNQAVAQQRRGIYTSGQFDDDDYSGSEDGASVCANEEDGGHQLKAAHFSRGRLSQKQKHDLLQWKDEGKPVDWIAKQLNRRRKENIAKLEEDARESLG
ncbi:hypothetical protein MY10362_006539 [Beauveria mimosiformis]